MAHPYSVQKKILYTVGAAGVLSMAVLAPNSLQALELFGIGKGDRRRRYYVKSTVSRMARQGLIEFRKNKRGVFIRLTDKGKFRLKEYAMGAYTIPVPRTWDRKYRIIIFDIKEYKRAVRDKLRAFLEGLGFVRLQNSVWVYPYECKEVITLLKASFKIGKDILYITAEEVENDKWLRRHFKLPLE